jgi:hypothetical protein
MRRYSSLVPLQGLVLVLKFIPGAPPLDSGAKCNRTMQTGFARPSCQRHARFALMGNERRPCAVTNDEVTLPVATLGSGVDRLGPFVDGDAILDGIWRRSRSARTAAFVPAREITPQLIGLVGLPCKRRSSRNPRTRRRRSFPPFSQPEICSGVHPSAMRSTTKVRKGQVARAAEIPPGDRSSRKQPEQLWR